MRLLFLLLITCFYFTYTQGQQKVKNPIPDLFKKATELRNAGAYEKALEIYQSIRKIRPDNNFLNYKYASLYGAMRKKDSCLKYLKAALHPMLGLRPLSDPDLFFLHNSPIWDSLESRILKVNAIRVQRIKDLDYAKKLYRLCAADQAFYSDIQIAERKFGRGSQEIKDIWKKKRALNKKNQETLIALLNEKGWPKRSEVGMQAARSAFLIIQHSDLDKMKQYIPIIKKLCNEGEGSCQSFALMFDRIQCSKNKPQRYGTQVRYNDDTKQYELFPLENEGLVHEYREWAGLPPIEDYAANWGIELNIKKVQRDFAYSDKLVRATLGIGSKYDVFHGMNLRHDVAKEKEIDRKIPGMIRVDPTSILGAQEEFCLTMPKGTEVIVQFSDNQIVDYPDQDDLFIKESGGANDKAVVYVSHDGKKYDSLGITFDGRASSLDLASIKYPYPVKFVKIVSLDNNGALPGYDLVYIKGLPGSNVDAKMNSKQIQSYLTKARKEVDKIMGMKSLKRGKVSTPIPQRPFILKNVHFDSRSAVIQRRSIPFLNRLVSELEKLKWNELIITGHTDNQGTEKSNKLLSINRAYAIRDYLWQKGISKKKISCSGMGATQPIRMNNTSAGRAKNRRVEIQIIQ